MAFTWFQAARGRRLGGDSLHFCCSALFAVVGISRRNKATTHLKRTQMILYYVILNFRCFGSACN